MLGDIGKFSTGSPSTFNNNVVLKSSINKISGLNISFLNTCSIYPKFDEILHLISGVNLEVICFAETWLRDRVPDAAISIPGFQLFRMDRQLANMERGGGICVYIKSTIVSKLIHKHCTSNLEAALFEIKNGIDTILLIVTYKPPKGLFRDELEAILAEFSIKYNDIIICGDFNCDPVAKKSAFTKFKRLLDRFGLKCKNTEPTHFSKTSSSLLDLIITNTEKIKFINQISVGFSDHDFLFFSYDVEYCRSNTTIEYRDFKNIDTLSLIQKCNQLPWDTIFNILNSNDKVIYLSHLIRNLFDEFVLVKTIYVKTSDPPWFNNTISNLIKIRNFTYNRWKRTKNNELFNEYKAIRNKTSNAIKNAKVQFCTKRLNPSLPPKVFWRNLKSISGLSTSGKCNINSEFSADDLNNHFTNHLSSVKDTIEFNSGSIDSGFSFHNIDIIDLTEAFSSIKSNSTGVDELPLTFIKLLLPSIDCYILHVFNSIITSSSFPLEWKHSKVIPIPKKTNPSELSDFRPISLLPALSKVLERILQVQILNYLESNKMLSIYQSAYRSNHSTTTALLNISDDIRRAIDNKKACITVLLDYSKAFDRINHQLFVKKLADIFGFSIPASRLLCSYLEGRSQTVFLNSSISRTSKISSGVPQGSVLGPFLFMMFINDITKVITNCKYHLFADDIQIYKSCDTNNISNCIRDVNLEIKSIIQWSIKNKLDLNSKKTQCILISSSNRNTDNLPKISVNGTEVCFSDVVSNLGLLFDKTLCWSYQVESMSKRIVFLLRMLWTTTKHFNYDLRLKLVKTYVLPHFLYGDIVMFDLQKQYLHYLQLIFNSCVRYVMRLRKFDHISQYINILFGCSLNDLYQFRVCLSIFKFLKYEQPEYIMNKIEKSQSVRMQIIKIPNNKTKLMNTSLFVRGISFWNSLPFEIKNSGTVASFKRNFFNHIRQV